MIFLNHKTFDADVEHVTIRKGWSANTCGIPKLETDVPR